MLLGKKGKSPALGGRVRKQPTADLTMLGEEQPLPPEEGQERLRPPTPGNAGCLCGRKGQKTFPTPSAGGDPGWDILQARGIHTCTISRVLRQRTTNSWLSLGGRGRWHRPLGGTGGGWAYWEVKGSGNTEKHSSMLALTLRTMWLQSTIRGIWVSWVTYGNWTNKLRPSSTPEGIEKKIKICSLKNTLKKIKWEKKFAKHISDKELVSRIYKELLEHNNKKDAPIKNGPWIWTLH